MRLAALFNADVYRSQDPRPPPASGRETSFMFLLSVGSLYAFAHGEQL
jgi:hypothetical protein